MLLKRNFIKFSPFLMVMIMLMSVFLPALPKAMAEEGDYFSQGADECFRNIYSWESGSPELIYKNLSLRIYANRDVNISHIEGSFSLTDAGASGLFELGALNPGLDFSISGNYTQSIETGTFTWDGDGGSVEVASDREIWSSDYKVSNDVVAGIYEFPMSITITTDTGEVVTQDNLSAVIVAGSTSYPLAGSFGVVNSAVADKVYDGTKAATVTSAIISDDSFEEGVDYTVNGEFYDADAGEWQVASVWVDNFSERVEEKYGYCVFSSQPSATIYPKQITADDVTLTPSSFRYSGEANVPEVAATTSLDGGATVTELRENTDFVLTRPVDTVSVGTKTIGFEATGNYTGTFDIDYEVEKAVSPNPPEMTAGYIIETGKTLADISGERTLGFAWDDPDTVILEGENIYPATYTYNNDTDNYTTIRVSVPVYGDTIGVEYDVLDGDGADYTIGSGVPARFKIGAPRDLFERGVEVFVDGEPIDDNDYIVESEDTTIILSDGFLNGLYAGGHLLRVVFDDGGIATAEFNMLEPEGGDDDPGYVPVPDTGVFGGDNGGAKAIGATMIGVVASAIAFAVLLGKKHYRVKKISFDKK